MTLSILQIIGIIVMCIIGFPRGWKREMISLAAIITGLIFLGLGGGPAMAFLLFVGVPFLFRAIQNGAPNTGVQVQSLPSPDSTAILVTSIVCFFLIIGLGYVIGKRIVDKPSKPVEHFLGLIPAAISGYILTTYVLGAIPLFAGLPLFSSQLMKVDFSVPSFLFIFIMAVLVVAAALIAGARKKTVAKPK
jgi:hypothetical protein